MKNTISLFVLSIFLVALMGLSIAAERDSDAVDQVLAAETADKQAPDESSDEPDCE